MSPAGLRLAVLGGVPVYVGRSWPVIALVVVVLFGPQVEQSIPSMGTVGAYLVALLYAVLLLASVLAHEAAHAVVATRFGYRVRAVVADLWGGHTAYETAGTRPGASALVAIAGPAANALLALAGWLILPQVTNEVAFLLAGAVVWTNGFVAIFNMLPGLPLDGGFLVEALVWKATGRREQGLLVAGWCGRVVAVGAVVWVLVIPLLRAERPSLFSIIWGGLIGAFLWTGATGAIRAARVETALGRITISGVWRPVAVLPESATVADAVVATNAQVPGSGRTAVVLNRIGQPIGLVDGQAVNGVPEHLRSVTAVLATVQHQPEGWVLIARPEESVVDVVGLMQQIGSRTVLVRLPNGAIGGVVQAADLETALSLALTRGCPQGRVVAECARVVGGQTGR